GAGGRDPRRRPGLRGGGRRGVRGRREPGGRVRPETGRGGHPGRRRRQAGRPGEGRPGKTGGRRGRPRGGPVSRDRGRAGTLLEPEFHGRGDGGAPEWPPSPLRLFQALVAAAAAGWRGGADGDAARPALRWLEARQPPVIVAPGHLAGRPFRLSVPNNDLDV